MKIYLLKRAKKALWKIGITSNMKNRKRQIQGTSGFAVSVWLCLTLPNARACEVWAHRLYKAKNKPQKGSGGTEWFALFFPFRFALAVLGAWLAWWLLVWGLLGFASLGLVWVGLGLIG